MKAPQTAICGVTSSLVAATYATKYVSLLGISDALHLGIFEQPEGEEMIPHSRPSIDEEDAREVQRVLLSGQLAQDGEVARFESRMASFVGVKGAAAVS